MYNDDRTQMKAFVYTFTHAAYADWWRRPIWLATEMRPIQSDGNWKAQLAIHRNLFDGELFIPTAPLHPILPERSTKVALVELESVDLILPDRAVENQLECVQDFNRLGRTGEGPDFEPVSGEARRCRAESSF